LNSEGIGRDEDAETMMGLETAHSAPRGNTELSCSQQLVALQRLFRNQQVNGSSPFAGSIRLALSE
jgi:hypothetical protein